jgi:predicted Fe-Mo cluster-binding NifX family protein
MKIAIASDQGRVSSHFGHCEHFVLYEITNHAICAKRELHNPGHRPGYLPLYLANLGVELVIAGGIGSGAIEIFEAHNIRVISGASGSVDNVIDRWLNNELSATHTACESHQFHGSCEQ